MGRLVCLDARTGKERWRVDEISGHYTTQTWDAGTLYVASDAADLHAVDAASGKVLWKYNYGNEAKGSPLFADGKIYVGDVPGAWQILDVSREGCKPLSEQHFEREGGAPDEIYATAAAAHGRVILCTLNNTFCISTKKPAFRTKTIPVVFGPAKPLKAGPTVKVGVEPAEVFVAPGQRVEFRVQGFDAKGVPTGLVEANYSLTGLEGTLSKQGVFTAEGSRIQAGTVTAQVGEMKAAARVRVIPKIPYAEDFESLPAGGVPPGWITSKLKAQVTEYEGGKVLRKLADKPSPPFARLRCYMMPPIETGHCVQADMLGVSKKNRFFPDMGLINSRYLLILTGSSERTRRLRLVSWSPVPRIIREIEYPWKGDEWYSVKLSVDIVDAKGQVRAKVWPRGENEPKEWSLTMEDPVPNPAGSPGLYAYSVGITSKSVGTEVLFDNVIIKPCQGE
jgi:hypothetical protein